MAKLSKIWIFPIKSLDAIAVNEVEITSGGALKGDREFALFDQKGLYINAKRNPKIHLIRSTYDLPNRLVSLCIQDLEANSRNITTFHLDQDRDSLSHWLSDFFEKPVEIRQNPSNGFPDDPESWGATIVSEATLRTVQSWYTSPQLRMEQLQQRFRTNLEIADTEPFWEDQLITISGKTVPFKIGQVQFLGTNPCQRCPVPTRDPFTGEVYPDFQKIFMRQREATLPVNIERSRFNHFYRLALNTQIPLTESGKVLKLGDSISLE
ncbi:MOSC N-terminal beta barrel domain-containing protein [Pseudanabaena sp. FACHB-1998]|uniref:MOSC domain-containing protein n=1 Tax=Pseudanabaena sp. FACHB-1998 TaxID=2692858 RepID=UPI0016807615|nr:MOSC N-terminal beta barrel domain-containing protein [Pseudanabaena sp. FACHB-1998]MBD2176585.1 MOSC N-terminal beta barrel domain-containing protein [Pseudanabaena sp. FACHB-1998]